MNLKDRYPNDCQRCGLPMQICSCSDPEGICCPLVRKVGTDRPIKGREISPAEGLSDFDKSELFTEAYLYGHDRQKNRVYNQIY